MEVYPCPLCGRRVNRRGAPFEDPSQVEAHIDGARDAAHKGQSGAAHADEIEAEEVDPSQFGRGGSDGDSGSLPSVETALTERLETGRTPLTNAVEMNARMVDGNADKIARLDGTVDAHQDNFDRHQEQIEELYRTIEWLLDQLEAAGAVNRGSEAIEWEHGP